MSFTVRRFVFAMRKRISTTRHVCHFCNTRLRVVFCNPSWLCFGENTYLISQIQVTHQTWNVFIIYKLNYFYQNLIFQHACTARKPLKKKRGSAPPHPRKSTPVGLSKDLTMQPGWRQKWTKSTNHFHCR